MQRTDNDLQEYESDAESSGDEIVSDSDDKLVNPEEIIQLPTHRTRSGRISRPPKRFVPTMTDSGLMKRSEFATRTEIDAILGSDDDEETYDEEESGAEGPNEYDNEDETEACDNADAQAMLQHDSEWVPPDTETLDDLSSDDNDDDDMVEIVSEDEVSDIEPQDVDESTIVNDDDDYRDSERAELADLPRIPGGIMRGISMVHQDDGITIIESGTANTEEGTFTVTPPLPMFPAREDMSTSSDHVPFDMPQLHRFESSGGAQLPEILTLSSDTQEISIESHWAPHASGVCTQCSHPNTLNVDGWCDFCWSAQGADINTPMI